MVRVGGGWGGGGDEGRVMERGGLRGCVVGGFEEAMCRVKEE